MKKVSIFISTIIALMVIASLTTVCMADDDEPYRERKPVIVIEEDKSIKEVSAGEEMNLVIKYTNDSEHTASNLKITPIFENVPLVYEKPVVFERTKSLRGRASDTVSFNFKVSDNAKLGVYALKFKCEFSNSRDETYSTEQVAYFKVVKEKVKPIINISDIQTGENAVYANTNFELKFNLLNDGEVDARNVEIKLTGLSVDSFMAVESNDYKYIGNLESGKVIPIIFKMFASDAVKRGTNTIGLEVKFKDAEGNEYTTEKTIYILDVKSENEKVDSSTTSAKPKIIISSYATNPASIVAGNEFSFNFTFKNTSKEKRLRNMKVTLSSTEGAFIITNGSNTFYIEDMGQSEEVTKNIVLKAKQDLTSNSYPVNIEFDYEDYAGNSYTATEIINMPVIEYSKLIINSVFANEAFVASPTNLSFSYINMGRATISNLTASVKGDYVSSQEVNYIGNLSAGTSDYYDIEVIPQNPGQNYGTLVLSFEDSSGKTIEIEKPFEGFAMEMQNFEGEGEGQGDDYSEYPIEEQNKVGTLTIVLSGAGTLILSFFITKAITAKIIRKKLEDEI